MDQQQGCSWHFVAWPFDCYSCVRIKKNCNNIADCHVLHKCASIILLFKFHLKIKGETDCSGDIPSSQSHSGLWLFGYCRVWSFLLIIYSFDFHCIQRNSITFTDTWPLLFIVTMSPWFVKHYNISFQSPWLYIKPYYFLFHVHTLKNPEISVEW